MMKIKNKILFVGVLFLLFASGLWAAKPEPIPEFKRASEYFASGKNEIPESAKAQALKKLTDTYSPINTSDAQIKKLQEIVQEASKLRGEKSFSEEAKKVLKDVQYKANSILESLKTPEEAFLGVVSNVGATKAAVEEALKKRWDVQKKSKDADVSIKGAFKYTQSIAHLLVVLDFEKEKKLCEYYKYLGKKENIKKEFNKTLADSVFKEYETCLKTMDEETIKIRQKMEKEPTILEKDTQIKNIESEINSLGDSPTRNNKVQKKFNMIAERTKELDDKIRDEIKKNISLQKIIKKKNDIDKILKVTNLCGYYDYLVLQKNDEEIKKFRETFDKVFLWEYYDSFIKHNNEGEKIKNFKENYVNSLIYYDYLVQNKDVKEIQKFEEALIKEAIRLNERETRYKEKMKDPYFFNIFNTAIKREEEFKNKFVFYSGYSSNFDFLNDFLTMAENLLFVEKKLRERSFFQEKLKMFETMKAFWASDEGGYIKRGEKDDGELTDYLCSTNIALFGNFFSFSANTYFYFTRDMSQQDPVPMLIKNLSESIGLNFDGFESSIKELHEKYKKIGGKLKQFFMSPSEVNDLAYMSIHRGHPFLVRDHVFNHSSEGFQHFANALLDRGIDTIEKVITFLRNNPDDPEFLKTFFLKGTPGVAIDFLQARVLMSPMLFDKEKVKIFYYFLSAEKEREHRFLQQELRDLVVKMIVDGLEKGTIQKNKVKVEALGKTVKLPSLYQKVMKPVIKDPLVTALTLFKAELLSLAQSLSGGATSKGIGKKKEGELKVLQDHPYSSIWPAVAKIVNGEKFPIENEKILKEISKLSLSEIFVSDCEKYKPLNKKIPKHVDNDGLFRIATYNVHSFWAPLVLSTVKINFNNILNVVWNVNADVIVLQEVAWNNKSKDKNDVFFIDNINNEFKKLGYVDSVYSDIGKGSMGGDNYGNVIFSKKDFLDKKAKKGKYEKEGEQPRSYAGVQIKLPNNKIVSLWGTHLDVYDETEKLREEQITYLVGLTEKQKNIIIAADFNADREQDYQYLVEGREAWNLVQTSYKAYLINYKKIKPFDIPQLVHNHLAANDFKDCFTKANILGPKFTVWTGKVVDFLYIKEKTWDKDLEIAGCYVYYDAASDHLPVIMDIKIK